MTHTESSSATPGISATVTQYVKLLIQDTRLNIAEKLTRLLSAIALCSLLLVIAIVAMLFVSLAVGYALTDFFTPVWSFIIMAGFYIVVFAVLILCRRFLIVNPISRFISRLLLEAPVPPAQNNESTPVS